MNDLNSVLLEGTLTQDPVLSHDPKGSPHCLLVISSERYLRGENGIEKRTTGMHIDSKGKIAEQCAKLCRRGSKIRVVGFLQALRGKNEAGRDAAQLVIEAEHVEIKPKPAVKQEKDTSYESYSR
jgi:single-stranded DNA-binding protein